MILLSSLSSPKYYRHLLSAVVSEHDSFFIIGISCRDHPVKNIFLKIKSEVFHLP